MILILGSTGMLGRYLVDYLSRHHADVKGLTRKDFDVLYDDVDKLFDYKPTVIINAIGIIPQAAALSVEEITVYKYRKVNGEFPIQLAYICRLRNVRMIHITTDCVYDGFRGSYSELDEPTEEGIYGASKSLGDCAGSDCTIIRTSIIGENDKGISLIEWVKSMDGKTINGDTNHIWNGMTCLQLSKIISRIIFENLYWKNIRHLFSETVNKYTLITLIINVYGLNIKVEPSASYRSNRCLTTIFTDIKWNIPCLYEQIKEQASFRQHLE